MKKELTSYSMADYNALLRSDIPASLVETPGMRFDAEEDASIYFARELDFVKAKTYDRIYPELSALTLFPRTSEVNAGAETVTYYSYDKTGMATIIDNYATDLPRADVKGKPTTAIIKSIGVSYGYSVQEMRAARMAGKPLDARKGDSARYQNDYLDNRIAWAGDKATGLMGILSEGNDIPYYTIKQGVGGKTEWMQKTPQEVLDDINGMQSFVTRVTKNIERPDTLAVPSDVYMHLTNTPRSDASDLSIAGWVLQNAPYLKKIVPAAELNADSDLNPFAPKAAAVLFKNDPDKFSIESPLPYMQYPVQTKGLEMIVPCETRTAGVIIYYPLSLLIAIGV